MIWKKDLQPLLFWGCIALLLGASLFYGLSAESMRHSLLKSEGKIDSGSLVTLARVIDGDSVIVVQEGQQPAALRILGIKAFDANIEKDVVAPYGQAVVDTLNRLMANQPARVLLHTPPRDRHGRYLGTLYIHDQDIGLHLVKEGLVMVYTAYPFPALSLYLHEQELARAGRRGLWANEEVAARALALIREWQGRNRE
ncbi:MAG: thermonuclease family protein [Candidatus Contendobacter sp.]|nr:thermonuclease family protein [Candidatus Contendobacter sp.]